MGVPLNTGTARETQLGDGLRNFDLVSVQATATIVLNPS